MQSAHPPLASLAAHWHACKGDIPPPLVGASITLVDDVLSGDPSSSTSTMTGAKAYLFGGRLITTRRMVNEVYVLDMTTLHWTRLEDDSGQIPHPRYFHSCDLWNGKLIIFGGMGHAQDDDSKLCVLNDIVAFDLATKTWDLNFGQSLTDRPEARYAHLSSITADILVIIGGQDMSNHYVESVDVFDLHRKEWVASRQVGKQRGSYRSLAVSPDWIIDEATASSPDPSSNVKHNVQLLPVSRKSYEPDGKESRLPIYVYTNHNFTDVMREMEVIEVSDEDDYNIEIDDELASMQGVSLPPGLRFPIGAMHGDYLIISGTYLANTSQTFAIWALNLPKMIWSRLDVGPLLASGSWNRGLLWSKQGKMVVFGHRERDLVSDYNHRQTNWDHILTAELEAWGIVQPPELPLSRSSIELGLQKLTSCILGGLSYSMKADMKALGGHGDFEILCSDGYRIGCDRAVLKRRWPFFEGLLEKDGGMYAREITIGEPSLVVVAFLTFLYTRCICTPLQRHPAIVAALLILSKIYAMTDLQVWAKYAAHITLAEDLHPPSYANDSGNAIPSTSLSSGGSQLDLPPLERHRLAVVLYEAATICGCEALQIRALRTVMSISRWAQRTSATLSPRSAQTPTTSSLRPEGSYFGSMQSAAQTGISSNSLKSDSTNRSPRKESFESGEASPVNLSRRPSKAERMLGLGSTDMVRRNSPLSKAEKLLGMSNADAAKMQTVSSGPYTTSRSISQSSIPTMSQQNNSPQYANLRRPSAPVVTGSQAPSSFLTSRSTSATDSSGGSHAGRKRFSIFGGRTSEVVRGPVSEGVEEERRPQTPTALNEKGITKQQHDRGERKTALTKLKATALKSIDTGQPLAFGTSNSNGSVASLVMDGRNPSHGVIVAGANKGVASKLTEKDLQTLYSV